MDKFKSYMPMVSSTGTSVYVNIAFLVLLVSGQRSNPFLNNLPAEPGLSKPTSVVISNIGLSEFAS